METLLIIISVSLNFIIIALGIIFKKSIESFIDFRKLKSIEELKRELDRLVLNKQRAELVAELFARKFNKPEEIYEFEKLNWQIALFLPKELICEISQKLVNGKNKAEVMELLIKIREHLGVKDGLLGENIAYIQPNIEGSQGG